MRISSFSTFAMLVAASGAAFASEAPRFGTFKVDVVALIRDHAETPGSGDLAADRYGYRYLFATSANREAFVKSPEKYEVQLGGACGKMGELSGRGSPERHWVYQNHLYVFASDGCRSSFQQNPEGHIDCDDSKPQGPPEAAGKGRELLDLATSWSGMNSLKPTGGFSTIYESTYQQGGQVLPLNSTVIVWRNGDYFSKDTYNGAGYTHQIKSGRALEIDTEGKAEEHVPSWKKALEAERSRNLAYVLISREAESSIAFLRKSEDGVAEVLTQTDGRSSTLWIREETGKILAYETVGRGKGGILGKVKRTFTAYETVEGITFPVAWSATFEGDPSKAHARDRVALKLL